MPGIAGIISQQPRVENEVELEAMLQCMLHEPYYEWGKEVDGSLGFARGWVCHKDTFSDCMPVWNEAHDVCLIFSGEDFTDRSELEQLRARGHKFNLENASYLVHLYEEYGDGFLTKLNGGFCGVIIDLRQNKMLLFNDRYGLNRLYYHENAKGLFFASEAKALLKVLPELRRLDPASLGEFFSCGCALQNRTLFSKMHLLPGGSLWTFFPGQPVRKESYFQSPQWEHQSTLSPNHYYEKLKETWARVLPRYFRGNQRIGLSLTGGVDSRMILAWIRRQPGRLPCYTFGGPYRECADVKVAREVARICQQSHEIIPVEKQFLRDFPALAERTVYLSDGAMDVTGAIDLYVQRRVREIAPVRVTGTNGGEILRRLVAFKPTSHGPSVLQGELRDSARAAATTYFQELQGHRLTFAAFKQTPWYMGSKFSIEKSHLTLRMPYFDNELVALSYQAPPEIAESNAPALRLIADGNPALQAIGTDRGLAFRAIPGLMQMRHQFQQFTFKAEYAYDYGMPQWLARMDNMVAPLHLERLFLGRHKFHHFRVYYRDHFANYVREMLLDPCTRRRPYLQGNRLEEMVRGHLGGYSNYTLEIHKILSSELIQRQLVESSYTN